MGIEQPNFLPKTIKEQKENLTDDIAKTRAREWLQQKMNVNVSAIEVYKEDVPAFQEQIDFIKGHPEDYLDNAKIDPTLVLRTAVATTNDGEGIVLALDRQMNVIGMAD